MSDLSPRKRMRAALRRREADRVPLVDSLWDETAVLWRGQGHLPPDAPAGDFFGFEWQMVHFDSGFLLETQDLEETDDYVVRKNTYGTTARFKKSQSAPSELLDFPIKSYRTGKNRTKTGGASWTA